MCVYTTGSFGRNDASKYSDLDTFIISLEEEMSSDRLLSGLEEIELAASIIDVNRKHGLPELDGDGGYLKAHSETEYLVGLGKPEDDANNTFTGRLLLLLESDVIFGETVYNQMIDECINRYWLDYTDHADSFMPAFLLNDILRFWRTLCINYEVGTQISPEKRRAKNFKLKYSRLLTCYSAVVGLQLLLRENNTVTKEQAVELVRATPLERVLRAADHGVRQNVETITEMYEEFLEETDCSKADLREKMKDTEYYGKELERARAFGDEFFLLIKSLAEMDSVGSPSWRLLRYVTV